MENSVTTKVAEQIAALSPSVETAVVETLVQREIDKRSEALVKCIDAHSKLRSDLNKIKADQVTYNLDGSKAAEVFSKAKVEEHNKLKAKVAKYEKAINKALTEGTKESFADVYNLANNPTAADKSDGKDTTEGAAEAG